jgi:hypothetical protein
MLLGLMALHAGPVRPFGTPGAHADSSAHDSPESADVAEIRRHQAEVSRRVQQIDFLRADGPVARFLQEPHGSVVSPMVARYKKVFEGPGARKDLADVLTHPDRLALLWIEGIWAGLMLAFFLWFRIKTRMRKNRLWSRVWITTLYLCGALGFLPELVFGTAYIRLFRAGFYVLTGTWGT